MANIWNINDRTEFDKAIINLKQQHENEKEELKTIIDELQSTFDFFNQKKERNDNNLMVEINKCLDCNRIDDIKDLDKPQTLINIIEAQHRKIKSINKELEFQKQTVQKFRRKLLNISNLVNGTPEGIIYK